MKIDYIDALNDVTRLKHSYYYDKDSLSKFKDLLEKVPNYLQDAYENCRFSHDPNTQVGASIVDLTGDIVSWGYNSLTWGMYNEWKDMPNCNVQAPDTDKIRQLPQCQSPIKYSYMEHAERMAIFRAARRGVKLQGTFMVCPYFSCVDCSRAIIESGIILVIGHKKALDLVPERWKDSIKMGRELFDAAGVDYIEYDGDLYDPNDKNIPDVTMNGKKFIP